MEQRLCVRTKGNASPQNKPRVYFTCHPQDFDRFFDIVCELLFRASDCAVFYYEDMSFLAPEDLRVVELEQMNLFVIPVTEHLLTQRSKALDEDFPFAVEYHIPVLPLMMESGLHELYRRRESLANRQYLTPDQTDLSEIPFEKKLETFLESVLTDAGTANRVKEAFLAYLFLSYRKKDRMLANKLIRQIHSSDACRDIAIWYDEYLTPDEDFNQTIADAMKRSSQFVLLVTPNLLEENNYIQKCEYPMACDIGKPVLAVMASETDTDSLRRLYDGVPDPIDSAQGELIQEKVLSCLPESVQEKTEDAEHLYLMGLAYLNGIDVEVDRERGVKLIQEAAGNGSTEAMKELRVMYTEGRGVVLDYEKALFWAQQLVGALKEKLGEKDPEVLEAMHQLALILNAAGKPAEARKLLEEVYDKYRKKKKLSGEELMTLHSLAKAYHATGATAEALKMEEGLYKLLQQRSQPEDEFMVIVMNLLASCYDLCGDILRAIKMQYQANEICLRLEGSESNVYWQAKHNLAEYLMVAGRFQEAYQEMCEAAEGMEKLLGKEHPYTLLVLRGKSRTMDRLGRQQEALKLAEDVYNAQCKALGAEHPETISTLAEVAHGLIAAGKYERAMKLEKSILEVEKRTLGESHVNTIATMGNIASLYERMGQVDEALAFSEEVLQRSRDLLGSDNQYTLVDMENLADLYRKKGRLEEALALQQKVYDARCRVLGKNHIETARAISSLGEIYAASGDLRKAAKFQRRAYEMRREQLGEEHSLTLEALNRWTYNLFEEREFYRAQGYAEKLYKSTLRLYGLLNENTLSALLVLASCTLMLDQRGRALELFEKLYEGNLKLLGAKDTRTKESLRILNSLKGGA